MKKKNNFVQVKMWKSTKLLVDIQAVNEGLSSAEHFHRLLKPFTNIKENFKSELKVLTENDLYKYKKPVKDWSDASSTSKVFNLYESDKQLVRLLALANNISIEEVANNLVYSNGDELMNFLGS